MTQWSVLYRKEVTEMWRSFRWLWVPIVFILLGAMQPVTTYYLPQILEVAGGLPEGAVISIPMPDGGQMMAEVLNQFGSIGILVLVLAGMGIVAGEKQHRYVSLIMVRPVSHGSFISAKWAAYLTLGISALVAGVLVAWYYTDLLIGKVDPLQLLLGTAWYAVWLIFIMTLTVLISTWLKSGGAAAFISLIMTIGVSVLTGLLERYMMWSPARMSTHATLQLIQGEPGDHAAWALLGAMLTIALLLTVAIILFRKQELAD